MTQEGRLQKAEFILRCIRPPKWTCWITIDLDLLLQDTDLQLQYPNLTSVHNIGQTGVDLLQNRMKYLTAERIQTQQSSFAMLLLSYTSQNQNQDQNQNHDILSCKLETTHLEKHFCLRVLKSINTQQPMVSSSSLPLITFPE